MKISSVLTVLETAAPPQLQEDYDNAGLITGLPDWDCTGILLALDATEDVIKDAIQQKCNLVVTHHPIVFKGLKKINGNNYVERAVIKAIKNDIAIYAIHTNLDNIIEGVNGKIASLLGLKNLSVLSGKKNLLRKLQTYVPQKNAEQVRDAVFNAGAGQIGNYSECSFNISGIGTFKAGKGAKPFIGKENERHQENEVRIEVIFPAYLEKQILAAMVEAHPYEEVAHDVIELSNSFKNIGSGLIGELDSGVEESGFIQKLKEVFKTPVVRHSAFTGRKIKKVAVCGGAGSFLITSALSSGADIYITADMKYHDFFEADNKILIADVGHFESEQYTIDLLQEILVQKFPTFAVLKTGVKTNPVNYFI